MHGVANQRGKIDVEVSISDLIFSQPDNVEWSASASFTCSPDDLQETISAKNNID